MPVSEIDRVKVLAYNKMRERDTLLNTASPEQIAFLNKLRSVENEWNAANARIVQLESTPASSEPASGKRKRGRPRKTPEVSRITETAASNGNGSPD